MRILLTALTIFGLSLSPVVAGEWGRIGYGRLINNDVLGDFQDRGQTGSYTSSRVFARNWSGKMPTRMGNLLEFRTSADIKAPANLVNPAAGDRPYAGSMTLGLHTHYQQSGFQIAFGGELVATGPQTGLDVLQTALHDGLGVAPPSAATRNGQIANGFYPGVVVEMGRPFQLSERTRMRPFVEGRYGVETLVRAGVDVVIGRLTDGDLLVRDGVSGQRYRAVLGERTGYSLVMGVDTALVSESAYLPASSGLSLSDRRDRARLGVHWEGNSARGFFGVTYLGKEFKTQNYEQVIGSVRIAFKF